MQASVEDIRALSRSAPGRWSSLHLVHESSRDHVEVHLRHGELRGTRLSDGVAISETGATPTSWQVREIEPIYQTYQWAAMLDPYELSEHVDITDICAEEMDGRRVWAFSARAEPGYEPICSCCPLVFSAVTERLEFGEQWSPAPGATFADAYRIALDDQTGIVVDLRPVGGGPAEDWFHNRIVSAA